MNDEIVIREPLTLLLGRSEFSLHERRLYWNILKALKAEQTFDVKSYRVEDRQFRIHYSDVFVGENSHAQTNVILKILDRVTSRKIKIFDQDRGKYTFIVPIPYIHYESNKGYFDIIVNSMVLPYFIDLSKGYSQYELSAAVSLSSEYSQLLFPRLTRFIDTGLWRVEVTELRELLNAQKYVRYSNLKQMVLSNAISEINRKTYLDVVITEQKEGRAVKWLNFIIRRKGKTSPKATYYELVNKDLKKAGELSLADKQKKATEFLYNYQFTDSQKKTILENEQYMNEFLRLDSMVTHGAVTVATTPTRYIAGILFKDPSGPKSKKRNTSGTNTQASKEKK
jgi:plasmid replication initiation protein